MISYIKRLICLKTVYSLSMCVLSLNKTSSMNTSYLFYKIDLLILLHKRHCKFHLCDCKSGFVNSSHTFQSTSPHSVHLDMLQLGIFITWVKYAIYFLSIISKNLIIKKNVVLFKSNRETKRDCFILLLYWWTVDIDMDIPEYYLYWFGWQSLYILLLLQCSPIYPFKHPSKQVPEVWWHALFLQNSLHVLLQFSA